VGCSGPGRKAVQLVLALSERHRLMLSTIRPRHQEKWGALTDDGPGHVGAI
jgi:hypothetical protein